MLERLKRVKKFWDLSKKEPEKVEALLNDQKIQDLVDKLPDALDGKAVFLSEGTEEEYKEFEEEQSGITAFLKKVGIK